MSEVGREDRSEARTGASVGSRPDNMSEVGREAAESTTRPVPDDVARLSYEQARDELVAIVAQLESGKVALEESMTLWERGEALAAHCSAWLDGAQARLAAGSAPAAPQSGSTGVRSSATVANSSND